MGQGGNYIPFGMLCDMGFSVGPGQSATFRDVIVRNNRSPNNILFREDLAAATYTGIYADAVKANAGLSVANGTYVLAGGSAGVVRRAEPQPQLDADAAHHVQDGRPRRSTAPASMSRRAASTRSS